MLRRSGNPMAALRAVTAAGAAARGGGAAVLQVSAQARPYSPEPPGDVEAGKASSANAESKLDTLMNDVRAIKERTEAQDQLRSDVKALVAGTTPYLLAQADKVESMKTDLKSELESMKTDLKSELESMKGTLKDSLESLDGKLESLSAKLDSLLHWRTGVMAVASFLVLTGGAYVKFVMSA